jgi:hypothetical protein
MTVAIPEAATAARASAGAASAPAMTPRPGPRGGRGAGPPPPRGFARPLPNPPQRQSSSRPSSTRQSSTRSGSGESRNRSRQRSPLDRARRAAPTDKVTRTNYQPVILAEFVAAILLVALSPVASKSNPDGLSPYAGKDMMKLGAVTGLYFVLALISTGGATAGRFAAWFGGLILLTVGLSETAHLASVFDLGGNAKAAAAKAVGGVTQKGKTIAGRN